MCVNNARLYVKEIQSGIFFSLRPREKRKIQELPGRHRCVGDDMYKRYRSEEGQEGREPNVCFKVKMHSFRNLLAKWACLYKFREESFEASNIKLTDKACKFELNLFVEIANRDKNSTAVNSELASQANYVDPPFKSLFSSSSLLLGEPISPFACPSQSFPCMWQSKYSPEQQGSRWERTPHAQSSTVYQRVKCQTLEQVQKHIVEPNTYVNATTLSLSFLA